MKPGLYWSYATRSLIRGGQRTVLAIFCVAVGVMAIIALQLVGLSVDQALIGNIVEANGGDIRLNAELAPLRQPDLAFFDKLKQQGRINSYATAYDPGGSIALCAAFSPDLPIAVLLGMRGFFENFKITFDPTTLQCELERLYAA